MGGFDYRASPDWAGLLGYSPAALEEMQLRAIDFLREIARPYAGQLPAVMYAGIVGLAATLLARPAHDRRGGRGLPLDPDGDAATAEVDLVEAMTFNSVPEAVGVARAAARAGLPASISFTLDSNHRLHSGPTLKEAIESVDARLWRRPAGVLRHQLLASARVPPSHRAGRLVRAGALPAPQRSNDGQDLAVHARPSRIRRSGRPRSANGAIAAASIRTSTSGADVAAPGRPTSTKIARRGQDVRPDGRLTHHCAHRA